MFEKESRSVPNVLYDNMAEYLVLDTVREQQKEKIIQQAMEKRAIRTLEAIRRVLEDDTYDDPECFYCVDALVMLFFEELGIQVSRHNEVDWKAKRQRFCEKNAVFFSSSVV